MAHSRMSAACLVLLLAGCTTQPTAAPVVVAPLPTAYTCEQTRQVAAELATLPIDAETRRFVADYGRQRAALRAVHNIPEPAACAGSPQGD